MQHTRITAGEGSEQPAIDERGSPRVTLLIRVAKLISPQGQFICVIRDISETGISLRGFHRLPVEGPLELELQTGDRHRIEPVWTRGSKAAFRFVDPVDVAAVVAEAGRFRKRPLRLAIGFPVELHISGNRISADVIDMSQQGAQISCDGRLALSQALVLQANNLPPVRARVRWRQGMHYGLAFDDTFSLAEFANLGARLQCPSLLDCSIREHCVGPIVTCDARPTSC